MLLLLALLACETTVPVQVNTAVRAATVSVEVSGPPEATLDVQGQPLTLDAGGKGQLTLSTSRFRAGETQLEVKDASGAVVSTKPLSIDHAPLLTPQGCETLSKEDRAGRVNLGARLGQEISCDFNHDGVAMIFFPSSPGAALTVGGEDIPDPPAGARVAELKLGALLLDVPLTDNGEPLGEGYALSAEVPTSVSVFGGDPVQHTLSVSAPRSATPELVIAALQGATKRGLAPGGEGSIAFLYPGVEGTIAELVGDPTPLGQLRGVAVAELGEERPAGTCGPYRDDQGQGPGIVPRVAVDAEIVVYGLNGAEKDRRAFRGGGQSCPPFVEGDRDNPDVELKVRSGPAPRAVRGWLGTLP